MNLGPTTIGTRLKKIVDDSRLARSPRRGLLLVAAFDLVFAINPAAGTLNTADHRIQFGHALAIDGIVAIAVMLALFAAAPLLSSGWEWRRYRHKPA